MKSLPLMKRWGLLMVLGIFALQIHARRGFAIVVDPKSYQEAKTEIAAYAQAIEEINGLKVYIVQDRWGVPDSIRCELKRLHQQKESPVEGAVLVGDIPVVMIRDAQHLTSAFKMNQAQPRKDSSIPSDRFYDDFGMVFKYLDKDDDAPYFYYSLSAESRQYLQSDIYTGRIRPTDVGGTSRYEKLRRYLRKAVEEKRHPRKLRQMFFFGGHGYISESIQARMDEKAGLYEHFPWLKGQQNAITYLDHSQQDVSKFPLMNELQRLDLDFAILHHHGAPGTQYMDGAPKIAMAERAKEFIQDYCRSYLRRAQRRKQDVDSVMRVLEKRFDIPASWIDNAFDAKIEEQDSVTSANKDLIIEDFSRYGYQPNCRLVIIDACFTGSFHLDDCIADEYIFNEGKTVAVIANSVNVLQDKWSDRYMGLLGLGAMAGFFPQYSGYLESQLLGDPTFSFAPAVKTADVNALLAARNAKSWRKFMTDKALPDMHSMAIEQLHRAGLIASHELLDIFRTSPSPLVRLQCLHALSENNDESFVEAMQLGVNDAYELVQRFALNYLSKNADSRLLPSLVSRLIATNTSPRCAFAAKNALAMYPEEDLMAEFSRQFDRDEVRYVQKEQVRQRIAKAIHQAAATWKENLDNMTGAQSTQKARKSAIRNTRNYCPPYVIRKMMDYIAACKDADIQVLMLESLGWRNHSCLAPEIAAFAQKVSLDSSYADNVRQEALKTFHRVKR